MSSQECAGSSRESNLDAPALTPDDFKSADMLVLPRQRTRFVEVTKHGIETIIEADAADVDRVLDFIAGSTIDRNLGVPGWDDVLFMDRRAIAVITHTEGQRPRVRRLDVAEGADQGGRR